MNGGYIPYHYLSDLASAQLVLVPAIVTAVATVATGLSAPARPHVGYTRGSECRM